MKLHGVAPEMIRALLARLPPCSHRFNYADACERVGTHRDVKDLSFCDVHKKEGIRSKQVEYADFVRFLEKKVYHLLRPIATASHTLRKFGVSMHSDGKWYVSTLQRARDAGFTGNPGGPFSSEDEADVEVVRLEALIE